MRRLVPRTRAVRAAERYYRIMYRGSNDSWNLRDRHMFDTLEALLATRGPDARAVVWAHNSHVGNAAATEMGWQGQFNIGELSKAAYRDAAVTVGFGTDRGTVAAADDWDAPMRLKTVRPARPDSYEHVFLKTGVARATFDLRADETLRAVFSEARLERAIGVIYRPETERQSHYFEAVLPEQFDVYVWFEETGPVTTLPTEAPKGVPETYPFGCDSRNRFARRVSRTGMQWSARRGHKSRFPSPYSMSSCGNVPVRKRMRGSS